MLHITAAYQKVRGGLYPLTKVGGLIPSISPPRWLRCLWLLPGKVEI